MELKSHPVFLVKTFIQILMPYYTNLHCNIYMNHFFMIDDNKPKLICFYLYLQNIEFSTSKSSFPFGNVFQYCILLKTPREDII